MYISHFPNPWNQMSFSEETALLPFLILIIHSLCNSQINLSKQYVRSNHILPTPTYDSVECYPPWNKTQIPYMAPVFLFLSPLTSSSSLPYSLYFNHSVLLAPPWICQSWFHHGLWSCKSLFLEYFSSRSRKCLLPHFTQVFACVTHSKWFPDSPFPPLSKITYCPHSSTYVDLFSLKLLSLSGIIVDHVMTVLCYIINI